MSAIDDGCYHYAASNGLFCQSLEERLNSGHEEADTRMVLHAQFIAETCVDASDVIVGTNDMDVFILLLHHPHRIKLNVLMNAGVSSTNLRRLIHISKLAEDLGPSVCSALVTLHVSMGAISRLHLFAKTRLTR